MIAFVLTLIYISISLLSPDVLPDALRDIHLLQIIAALALLSCLPELVQSRVFRMRDTYFVTAVLCAAFLSIVTSGWIGGAVSVAINFLPIIAAYYFVVISCTNLTRLKILTAVLFAVECSIVIHGMLAVNSGVLISPYFIREGEAFRYRGLGVINDPNDFAQVLVATIPLLWLRWRKGALASNTFLTILPAAFLCFGVYSTHSRGGLLALIVMMLYGLKDRLGIIGSVVLTGFLCAGLVLSNASGGRNMNNDDGDRIGLWSTALSTFKTHPVTGIGMDRFGEYSENGLTAHNSYVLCLAELGIIGYLCWMGTIVTSWSGLAAISVEPAAGETDPPGLPPRFRPAAGQQAALKPPQPSISPRINVSKTSTLRPSPPLPDEQSSTPVDLPTLVRVSYVMRSAMIGVLTSAFFISRTYAMILYIVFGMSAALQVIYQRSSGQKAPDVPIFRRTALATVLSILLLYLFIRIRGSH